MISQATTGRGASCSSGSSISIASNSSSRTMSASSSWVVSTHPLPSVRAATIAASRNLGGRRTRVAPLHFGQIGSSSDRRTGLLSAALLVRIQDGGGGRVTDESKPVDPEWALSPSEVARAFGVRPGTVVRWTDRGLLPCLRTADGCRIYRQSDVSALKARLATGDWPDLQTSPDQ